MKKLTELTGLTLRDLFASNAMTGELSSQDENYQIIENDAIKNLAKKSYKIADAMIKERNKNETRKQSIYEKKFKL